MAVELPPAMRMDGPLFIHRRAERPGEMRRAATIDPIDAANRENQPQNLPIHRPTLWNKTEKKIQVVSFNIFS